MHLALGLVDDVQIHPLAHVDLVEGAVAKGGHKALPLHRVRLSVGLVFHRDVLAPFIQRPGLQKHAGQAGHGAALHAHADVLPLV